MNLWSVVRRLSIQEIFRLGIVMIQNPLLIYPTLKATKQTISICDKVYRKAHHNNRKGNAFRHALWNVLICLKVFKITKNVEKSVIWAQKVTDLHEKLAPNPPLEKVMDLHNNEIGRMFFDSLKNSSEEDTITFLKEKTEKAKKIMDIKSIASYKNDLVYLSEE